MLTCIVLARSLSGCLDRVQSVVPSLHADPSVLLSSATPAAARPTSAAAVTALLVATTQHSVQKCEKSMEHLFVTKYWNDTYTCVILKNN